MKDPRPLLLEHELPEEIASMLRAADEDVHPNAVAQGERLLTQFAPRAPSTTFPITRRFGVLRASLVSTGLAVVVGLVVYGWRAGSTESHSSSLPAPPVIASSAVASSGITSPTNAFPAAPSVATASESVSTLPSIDVSALPSSPPEPRRAPAPGASRTERSNANLDQELAYIDRGRALLASGKPSGALAEVDAYRRAYAVQSFADEADSLEVRALAASGRTSEARMLAERFLRKRPGSPYAEPVRAAVGMTR
jgi:hypothetical protein